MSFVNAYPRTVVGHVGELWGGGCCSLGYVREKQEIPSEADKEAQRTVEFKDEDHVVLLTYLATF